MGTLINPRFAAYRKSGSDEPYMCWILKMKNRYHAGIGLDDNSIPGGHPIANHGDFTRWVVANCEGHHD